MRVLTITQEDVIDIIAVHGFKQIHAIFTGSPSEKAEATTKLEVINDILKDINAHFDTEA